MDSRHDILTGTETGPTRPQRSLADTLAPLDRLAQNSPSLLNKPLASFTVGGQSYSLPRYLFIGPKGGDDPIRLGLFAGIHGDEPAGVYALIELLHCLAAHPELAVGYCLFVYPVCNPTGFEDSTRLSRRGIDLNREFWTQSQEPEVQHLQSELIVHSLHGLVALHTDNTSHGLYGFVRGATLTRYLLEPALAAAEELLPRNENARIDGFPARNGIIRQNYDGVLSAPPKVRPRPFEIVLETPETAPRYLQQKALVAALLTIIGEYRKLMAYSPNL